MRKISKKTLETLLGDDRMKRCCLFRLGDCFGKIEFHHNLIYAGKQSDIPNTILPVCKAHHDKADKKEVKEILDWIMLNQMTERDFLSLPKYSYYTKRNYLNKKYGHYKN